MSRTGSRPRTFKRTVETIAVALPVLVATTALATGTVGVGLHGALWLTGVVALTVAVYTQHWTAYLLLLGAGIGALLISGMLALAFWVVGGLYIAIAVPNLVVAILVSVRGAAAPLPLSPVSPAPPRPGPRSASGEAPPAEA